MSQRTESTASDTHHLAAQPQEWILGAVMINLDGSHFVPTVGSWTPKPKSTGVSRRDQPGAFPLDTRTLTNGW